LAISLATSLVAKRGADVVVVVKSSEVAT
jgi:hypothetical protein